MTKGDAGEPSLQRRWGWRVVDTQPPGGVLLDLRWPARRTLSAGMPLGCCAADRIRPLNVCTLVKVGAGHSTLVVPRRIV